MDLHFDVLVVGTGLAESVTAAAFSKAGYKVLHVDTTAYYGASEASLSAFELFSWAKANELDSDLTSSRTKFSSVSASEVPETLSGHSLSLAPSIIPSTGPLITALIESGVSRYGGFKLLKGVGVYRSGDVKPVPGSKEDIFKSKDVSLADKRKLMRFLVFASGKFENTHELAGKEDMPFIQFLRDVFLFQQELVDAIAYAVAFCASSSDTTLQALLRTRKYLLAAGRYGPSPFLIAHYGGLGEIAQGFCRACAVNGGTYILGHKIRSLVEVDTQPPEESEPTAKPTPSHRYEITLEDIPDSFTADYVVASSDIANVDIASLLPSASECSSDQSSLVRTCCGIAIIDQPVRFAHHSQPVNDTEEGSSSSGTAGEVDAAILVFPPNSLSTGEAKGPVTVMFQGSGTLSCPAGQHVVYLSTALPQDTSVPQPDPQQILSPYLTASLAATTPSSSLTIPYSTDQPLSPSEPLFTAFYIHTGPSIPDESSSSPLLPQESSSSSTSPQLSSSLPSTISPIKILPTVWQIPSITSHLASNGDMAIQIAESMFWEINKETGKVERIPAGGENEDRRELVSIWPEREVEEED